MITMQHVIEAAWELGGFDKGGIRPGFTEALAAVQAAPVELCLLGAEATLYAPKPDHRHPYWVIDVFTARGNLPKCHTADEAFAVSHLLSRPDFRVLKQLATAKAKPKQPA